MSTQGSSVNPERKTFRLTQVGSVRIDCIGHYRDGLCSFKKTTSSTATVHNKKKYVRKITCHPKRDNNSQFYALLPFIFFVPFLFSILSLALSLSFQKNESNGNEKRRKQKPAKNASRFVISFPL